LQRFESVQIELRTNEEFAFAMSIKSQILGRTFWSSNASRKRTLSPAIFPRHQIVYSLTSICVSVLIISIRILIAWCSISLSTKELSLDAIFVRHQIASNCNFGDSIDLASEKSLGIKFLSTVFWIGGSDSNESSFRRKVTAKIWIIGMSDQMRPSTLSKSFKLTTMLLPSWITYSIGLCYA